MEKSKIGVVATWLSIFLNIALFGIKYWAGIVSNSVALLADAWHTLSDSVSSLAVLLGLKVSNIPADKKHPFGHGRAELIASLVVGILLAIVGFNFLGESILKFKERAVFNYGPVAIWVTVVSVIIKEVMARYSITIGKKIKSNSLKADGWHHRSDAISSIVILVGIFAGGRFWWADSVLGILVSLMIFYTTYTIMRETISILLGENIEPEMEQKIVELGETINGNVFLDPHSFKMHHYGHHSELVFHISLPGIYSLSKAHEIASEYELRIEKEYAIEVTIHVDAIDGIKPLKN
ncbi:cation diffusion facilitator family transporter [Marinilabilia salmonicolor]|uniref:cation diffusion facilitator family transporter n=1 Tax=Marinilabilia salmonicolor TaxID=989 RepID=UPI00029AB5C7|nr:cation diffusion facilitator family transporter [Marinilabilia salmonicolor]